eukprot:SAG11_NODE_113_length_16061_cov_16.161143_7_plen_249_part_00
MVRSMRMATPLHSTASSLSLRSSLWRHDRKPETSALLVTTALRKAQTAKDAVLRRVEAEWQGMLRHADACILARTKHSAGLQCHKDHVPVQRTALARCGSWRRTAEQLMRQPSLADLVEHDEDECRKRRCKWTGAGEPGHVQCKNDDGWVQGRAATTNAHQRHVRHRRLGPPQREAATPSAAVPRAPSPQCPPPHRSHDAASMQRFAGGGAWVTRRRLQCLQRTAHRSGRRAGCASPARPGGCRRRAA